MAKQIIDITYEFKDSVFCLFEFMSNYKNLTKIFKYSKSRRIKEGNGHPDGLGSVRSMRILGFPGFLETVTAFVPNGRIEYAITKGSPLKNHYGKMRFSSTAEGGSQIHYTIEFEGRFPGIGPLVRLFLESSMKQAFERLRLAPLQ